VIDKSVNQTVWNKGVLAQSFDDHSVTAADHSVAAGRDISGEVANGDGDVVGDGNDVGNTSYRDDHSINDSFNGNNVADHGGVAGRENQVADHGGVAGNGNDGNATNPDHSAVATTGGRLDASANDSHDVKISDSFKDSHDEAYTRTDTDSHDDNSHSAHISEKNYQSFNDESFDHHNDNGQSFNDGSALSDTHQAGLVNLNASPAVALPVEGNHVDVIHPA
ncbi:MAG TPA: hypothetical protein VFO16_02555, partial [Pseudonocardiaceae bacterium]|nr:hypothetical protein [Pseudonocardiaceae bacterium]